ncbi:hypothetical protein PHYPSEUDO_012549 [Phytophthora pseudosyringae]|uniref:Uncharacterized protein n=1 Tax=Phytophthora pseudosyringae TaxID=221518 RepID=A0A8T1V7G5_9STRA|nr:hypothetical protein PHYPSEUDO_012549 [Phytophthora pseudosyringae]
MRDARDQTQLGPDEDKDPAMEQVHAAWLAAGANGDDAAMRHLRAQHPQWLDLQRFRCVVVSDLKLVGVAAGTTSGSPALDQRQFCGWEDFHLPTIGASALLTAAWDGCVGIVALLLEAGQDPDASDNGGLTAIMVAILRYNVVVMRCVFRNGDAIRRNLVVDCREEESELLHNILAITELLLRFGGDVSLRNQDGSSALHYAANSDAFVVAKFLLDAGADIDAQDQNGKTPLHQCIREKSLLVANLLVSRGAQIDIEDANSGTPLTLALQRQNATMLQIILNQHHVVATYERRDFAASVLLRAVETEVEEAVRLVVEGGYSPVTVRNLAGETPLHRAIMKRNSQLMELLMTLDPAGGTLTAVTERGDAPAHYAACYGSACELEALLRRLAAEFGDLGALGVEANPINDTNDAGSTCLYLAGTRPGRLQEERDAIARLLLQHGARLFRRDAIVTRSGSSEQIILHEQVRRGMAGWVLEASGRGSDSVDGDDDQDRRIEAQASDTLLAELCVEWVAGVSSLPSPSSSVVGERHPKWPDFAAVLHVVVSVGFALEFMPLLLELPLRRSGIPALLRRLERFSRFPRAHALLLQLHVELSEALAASET